MRLPIILPDKYSDVQRSLAVDMKEGIARSFQGFINIGADGALLGPWNPWLQEPEFGKPVWELTKAMAFNPSLPPAVREIAILVTGAHFKARHMKFTLTGSRQSVKACLTKSSRPLWQANAQ